MKAWEPDLRILPHVFQVLRHDWVYNFFFQSADPDLDSLRHPSAKPDLSTAEQHLTTLPADHAQDPTVRVDESRRLLLLPAYSVGPITVGFAINELLTPTKALDSSHLYLARVARDDLSGSCLSIADAFDHNTTELSFYSLLSSTTREHLVARFHRSSFRALIHSLHTSPDLQAFRRALLYFYYATEAPPCTTCPFNPTTTIPCPCRLALRPKVHPTHLHADIPHMAMYAGAYKAHAHVAILSPPHALVQIKCACISRTRVTNDPDVRRRLAQFALSVAKPRPDPLAGRVAPPPPASLSHSVSQMEGYLLASIADYVAPAGHHPLTPSSTPPSISVAVAVAAVAAPAAAARSTPMQAALRPHVRAEAPTDDIVSARGSSSMSIPMLTATTPCTIDSDATARNTAASSIVQNGTTDSGAASPPMGTSSQTQSALARPRREKSPTGVREVQGVQEAATTAEGPAAEAEKGKHEWRAVPLAPAPTCVGALRATFILPSAESGGGDGAGVTSGDVYRGAEMDERKRKVELRKARNRESAQRSNYKRKMRIQALKDAIREMEAREVTLRKRERMLRDENRSLRSKRRSVVG